MIKDISRTTTTTTKKKQPFWKRVLIVDDGAFEPNFYDLMLIDINLPGINGFQLCEKILELDVNVRVCFMSSGEINREALREIYPRISLGCFI